MSPRPLISSSRGVRYCPSSGGKQIVVEDGDGDDDHAEQVDSNKCGTSARFQWLGAFQKIHV
jgi:hypothetical protein